MNNATGILTGEVYLGLLPESSVTATLEYSFDVSNGDLYVQYTIIDPATGDTYAVTTGQVTWD